MYISQKPIKIDTEDFKLGMANFCTLLEIMEVQMCFNTSGAFQNPYTLLIELGTEIKMLQNELETLKIFNPVVFPGWDKNGLKKKFPSLYRWGFLFGNLV